MEFRALTDFFASLAYAKKKYPQYVTYVNKYLPKLEEADQHREVEALKRFLIANQNTQARKLDCVLFQTGRPATNLCMSNFIDTAHASLFWESVDALERTLFRFGKPTELPSPAAASGLESAMERFKDNPLMTDILGHAKKSLVNLDGVQDINDLLNTPGFQDIVERMKTNIMSGQYSLSDLASSVTTVINTVQSEVDDSTKEALTAVSSAMSSMENNQQVDLDKLMTIVGSLRFNK
jgi:hypothetical protein